MGLLSRRCLVSLLSLGLGGALAGCGSAMPGADGPAAAAATPGKAKRRGKAERLAEDPKIGVYTSIPWGFDTASYWIEGPEGLIVIDTQFLVSAAGEMIEAAEAITGKKVKLAIVLHPNPDKFNGTSTFQAHGVKVVTSAQVVAQIPEVHVKRTEAFFERYKPDYPAEQPRPESFGDADQELSAGGVTVKVRVMGTGCSAAHVAVEYGEHLFVGDLVGNGTHAWLEIGEAEAWIERLKELSSPPHRFVHPGRGKSGGPELLTWEEGYLQRVLAEVAKEGPVMPPPAGALDRVKGRILEAYPGLAYDVFLELGLPAVWETQALKASKGGG